MKTILIAVVLAIFAFTTTDELTGRWESKSKKTGNITGVVFKSDLTFEGYFNKKPFASGTYTVQDSIFSFVDNGCNGARGTYKLIFYSNSDSLRLEAISDSCTERKTGMENLAFRRIN